MTIPDPSFWETPRGLGLLIAVTTIVAGVLGYGFGHTFASTPLEITVHFDQPIIVKLQQ